MRGANSDDVSYIERRAAAAAFAAGRQALRLREFAAARAFVQAALGGDSRPLKHRVWRLVSRLPGSRLCSLHQMRRASKGA